jgi:uncharacterized protein (DUF934 family)
MSLPRPEAPSVPGGGNVPHAQALASPPPPTPPRKGEGSDGAIWRNGAFEADTWSKVGADAPIGDGPVIVSKKRWLAERGALGARTAPLGLQLEPGESLEDIASDLPQFALIALSFPKYSDGRAFSTARLLREKYGYAGELRAVGNVLNDQVAFMWRVGFDTLEVTHAPTRRALLDGTISQVKLYYQPSGITEPPAGTRPWLRRAKA